jgi:hypothetical protein
VPPLSLIVARLRLRLHRRAVATWLTVVLCSATAGFVARGGSGRSSPAPAATRRVVVATANLTPGASLDGHVRYADVDTSIVPAGAVTRLPRHRAARVTLHRGEVLVTDRVSGRTGAGPAALLAPGFSGVAVPLPDTAPTLRVGDRVDVVDTTAAGEARVVGHRLEVIDAHAESITVAVRADEVPSLASSLADGELTVVFVGPPS